MEKNNIKLLRQNTGPPKHTTINQKAAVSFLIVINTEWELWIIIVITAGKNKFLEMHRKQ